MMHLRRVEPVARERVGHAVGVALVAQLAAATRSSRSAARTRLRPTPRVWRQVSSITQAPMRVIRPVSSACGMNASGGMNAEVGVVPADQRLEAAHWPVARSWIGW